MALLDLSMQDRRYAQTQAPRAKELTKGAIDLCLISSGRNKKGYPITVNQVICGVQQRPHSQRLLQIKNRWPPEVHTKMLTP